MWTDERIEILEKLWAEGLSASQVAAQLGGVSRNAVIGKVHRMHLGKRGRGSSRKKVAATAAAASPKQGKTSQPPAKVTATRASAMPALFDQDDRREIVVRPPSASVVVPISRRLKLVQLTEKTCSWPNGDPLSEDFSFCGNEVSERGGSYCGFHASVAFQPAAEKRRHR